MAINNDINKGILSLITKGSSLSKAYSKVYIGLLTTLPTDAADMSAENHTWEEVDFIYNGADTGYGRYPLGQPSGYRTGAHGDTVISSDYPQWNSAEKACIIVNDGDDMMFPNIIETLNQSVQWNVRGFALFSDDTDGEMIAYGKLVGEDGSATSVTLSAGSVPIFYKNKFKLMLKDADAPAAGGNS